MPTKLPRLLLPVSVLVASCAALLPSRTASALTPVAGGTYGDLTWTAAGSPYVVTGDVTIASGATLAIQPGVEVQFTNNPLLLIMGTLTAAGTAASPITFKAQAGMGKSLWKGIKLNPGAAGATLTHVNIESAFKGIESNLTGTLFGMTSSSVSFCAVGINVNAGVPVLDRLTIFGNTEGIVYNGSGGGTVSKSIISGSSLLGVDVYFTTANLPIAITNTVIRQGVGGVGATGNSNAVSVHITNSTIHGNSSNGVTGAGAASGPTVFIKNSIITQNMPSGIFTTGGMISTTYSDVWGNGTDYSGTAAGAGCISQDPLYVSAPKDLALKSSSVCIDSGTASGAPLDDLLGVARPLDGDGANGAQFDMGAYEFVPSSVCGDGVVGAGEVCDSGAQNGTYGNCKADCSGMGPSCGDGIVNGPEACDDKNQDNTDGCLTTCVLATCGDGFVHAGVEVCDDGNGIAGDGCSPQCKDENAGAGGGQGQGGMSSAAAGTGGAGGGGAGGSGEKEGGCGCRAAGSSDGPAAAWLLVAAVVAARRRRCGRRCPHSGNFLGSARLGQ